MTAQDQATARRIARIMRASRKRNGLTQQKVAAKLGISQGALSKMEHGLLIPSAPQWFDFCEMTHIPAESLKTGFIDRLERVTLSDCRPDVGFKVPRIYGESCGSKVRALMPLVRYFRKAAGDDTFEAFCRAKKIDPDFFLDFDNQINLNVMLDMTRELMKTGYLKNGDPGGVIEQAMDPTSHGLLQAQVQSKHTGPEALRALVESSPYYECNFDYKVEELGPNHSQLTVRPGAHLAQFSYRNDAVLGDFICHYKKAYFAKVPALGGAHEASLIEKQCMYHGADSCVYDFTWNR